MGIVLVWARGCGMGEASSVIRVEKECRSEKKFVGSGQVLIHGINVRQQYVFRFEYSSFIS